MLRILAASRVSCPVAGFMRMISTVWPTYFSSIFAGVSRSKLKFCSLTCSLPGWLMLRSRAVSGRICALTPRIARSVMPDGRLILRLSLISARSLL
ncbi:hypothetical protein [Thiolapillus sp.]|uniref:hypothetical protein n=1 Tax=Thiolapillus sp. TaxID=2017437 RepID=UPI003AF73402